MTYAITAIDALADPRRRDIVARLRDGPRSVSELARGLPVSRPAVSQHLKVLKDAGLVSVTARGTKREYALKPDGIADLRRYLDELWTDALAAYSAAAHHWAHDISEGENDEN